MKTKFYVRLVMICTSFFLFAGMAYAQQTHLEIPIVDDYDDAEEVTTDMWDPIGTVYRESSDLELYWDDGPQYVGTLFRNVQIPQGATIDSAYIQFVCKSAGADDISIEIYGVDSVTVDSIFDILNGVSGKAKTAATIDWSPDPWINEFDILPEQRTPYLNTIIEEIVAKDGWVEGNNLMFVLTGTVDENKIRHAYSYDMEEEGPVLHVWYSTQQTHLEIPIVDDYDDAEEVTTDMWDPIGTVYRESSDLELYWDDGPQYVGTLFRNVQIPQGATIDSAYIQFVCKSAGADDISIEIYGVDSVTVDSIFDILNGVSGKAKTAATIDWSPAPWIAEFDINPEERTPYLNTIIDEIVGKDGWVAGNNLMFVLTGTVDENKIRHAYSFDMEEEGPVLHVWFSPGTSTGNKLIRSTDLNVLIYPNPTDGKLYIENSSSDKFSYNIYSITGSLVGSRQNITTSRADIDLSNLTKGVYLISIITREKMETHRVILK